MQSRLPCVGSLRGTLVAVLPLLGCAPGALPDAATGVLTYHRGNRIYQVDLSTGESLEVAVGTSPYQSESGALVYEGLDGLMLDSGAGAEKVADCWLCIGPTVSADGRWLAWNDETSGGFGVRVVSTASGRVEYEIDDWDGGRPAWSVDGYLLVGGSPSWGTAGIAVVDLDTGDMALYSDAITDAEHLTLRPDASWAAAVSQGQIWAVPMGGGAGDAIQVTTGSAGVSYPFFSPDGEWLMVEYGTAGGELLVVPALPDEPVDLDAGEGVPVKDASGALWADGPFTWR